MRLIDIDRLSSLNGVLGASLVGGDGLVILQSGRIGETVAPLITLLISTWQSDENVQRFGWREIYRDEKVYLIYPLDAGTLILICEKSSNFGKIRLEGQQYMDAINQIKHDTFYDYSLGLLL